MDPYIDSLTTETYFHQRPHFNFMNKLYYDNNFFKRFMPFYEYRSFNPNERQRSSHWYGRAPQGSWVDGIIDYTYNKANVQSIGHFEMHENRKNKPQKQHNGGDATEDDFINPKYAHFPLPKGCTKEIKTYEKCRQQSGKSCIEEKINIVEICPKWALEQLRENKKFTMKATIIDNNTYRKAMEVSLYNEGRSLRDLKDRHAHLKKYRGDGYWADDRYNPVIYPSADQNTNIVLGDKVVYNDLFGGNFVELVEDEREKYKSM